MVDPVLVSERGWSYRVDRSVAWFTIERPDALNALDLDVLSGLGRAVQMADEDQAVRVLALRGGGGRAFSTGVDLAWFLAEDLMADAGRNLTFTAMIRDRLRAVEDSDVVTIAVVEGYALAGGLELALACDLLLCTGESRLGDQHANFGLMPGAGGTQRLPRRVGQQRALELMLTGRHVHGQEAVQIGLALASSPAETFPNVLEELLSHLRHKSRAGAAHIKRAVRRGAGLPLLQALEMERLTATEYFATCPDALEGLHAFRDR